MPEFKIDTENVNHRLDQFLVDHKDELSDESEHLSRSYIQKIISAGSVKVNDELVKPNYRLKDGDEIICSIPKEEIFVLKAVDKPIDILFEDEYILVINKPTDLLVHPDAYTSDDTLIQRIIFKYPEIKKAIYNSDDPMSRLRPGIIHRLDRDTTGVIIVAKNIESLNKFAEILKNREIEKTYIALSYGKPNQEGKITTYINRSKSDQNRMRSSKDPAKGKIAITHLDKVEYNPEKNMSLVTCRIETGRTHQIRLHLKGLGSPVIGDILYGNKLSLALSNKLHTNRQLLHASTVSFKHPFTGKQVIVEAPLPNDIIEVWN